MKIDNSQLQCFIDCPQRYKYRYIDCLRKVRYDERDLDKDFGSCIHKALELLYKEEGLDKAKQMFREEFKGLTEEKAKTPANGERLIELYWNYWQQPTNALSDTNLKTLAVEVTDTYNIGKDLDWTVKIDRIVESSSGIWVMDHKTTRSIAYNYFWQFDPNQQISGYCDYTKEKYGQCSGAIINVISLGYRQNKYKDNPAGFYCEFARDIINRNSAQLQAFRHNALIWAQVLAQALQTSTFSRNESACHSFKGCPFKEACISCGDEEVLSTLYEKHNPFEYLEGKE